MIFNIISTATIAQGSVCSFTVPFKVIMGYIDDIVNWKYLFESFKLSSFAQNLFQADFILTSKSFQVGVHMDDAENIGAGTVRSIFLSFIGKDKNLPLVSFVGKDKNLSLGRCPTSQLTRTTWRTQAELVTAMQDSTSLTGSSPAKHSES